MVAILDHAVDSILNVLHRCNDRTLDTFVEL